MNYKIFCNIFHLQNETTIVQFTHSLYRVYCWKIIQKRMIAVDNFHVKIRHTYTHFFHVFKSCIGFMLSNCVYEKNVYMLSYVFQK